MTKRLYGDVLGDEDSSYWCLITGGVVELPSGNLFIIDKML